MKIQVIWFHNYSFNRQFLCNYNLILPSPYQHKLQVPFWIFQAVSYGILQPVQVCHSERIFQRLVQKPMKWKSELLIEFFRLLDTFGLFQNINSHFHENGKKRPSSPVIFFFPFRNWRKKIRLSYQINDYNLIIPIIKYDKML